MKSKDVELTAKNRAPLDTLDRQLLYWLDRDSRLSIPALCRHVHASAARVRYHIDQLVERKDILSFITVIDYRLLGWRVYTLHYKLRELSRERQDTLMKKIQRNVGLVDLFLTEGSYDMQVAFLAVDLDEAADMMAVLREHLGPYIVEERMTIHLRSQVYPCNSLLPGAEGGERTKPLRVLDLPPNPIKLDEADTRLLQVISDHAEWPMWRIAKSAGLEGPTAYARIARLEKQKIILGYSVLLNPNLPGFLSYRIFVKLHYISPQRRDELVRYLQQLPQIYRSTFVFGDYDLYYDLMASGADERRSIMQDVYERFGSEIIRQDWVRVYSILKFSYFLSSIEKKKGR